LQVKKPLPAHSYAVIEFENPANKTLPYITEGSIEDIQNTFAAPVSQWVSGQVLFVNGGGVQTLD